MHVSGVKMIGRMRRVQIHGQKLYFILKFLAGNSKFSYWSNVTLQKWDIYIVMMHITAYIELKKDFQAKQKYAQKPLLWENLPLI